MQIREYTEGFVKVSTHDVSLEGGGYEACLVVGGLLFAFHSILPPYGTREGMVVYRDITHDYKNNISPEEFRKFAIKNPHLLG